jgi:hypothetical protein
MDDPVLSLVVADGPAVGEIRICGPRGIAALAVRREGIERLYRRGIARIRRRHLGPEAQRPFALDRRLEPGLLALLQLRALRRVVAVIAAAAGTRTRTTWTRFDRHTLCRLSFDVDSNRWHGLQPKILPASFVAVHPRFSPPGLAHLNARRYSSVLLSPNKQ